MDSRTEKEKFGDDCEAAWFSHLKSRGDCAVLRLHAIKGNATQSATNTPVMHLPDGYEHTAPDFFVFHRTGEREFHEVKGRRSPIYTGDGRVEHGVVRLNFSCYRRIAEATGCPVWIYLFHVDTRAGTAGWYRIDSQRAAEVGRYVPNFFGQEGFVWPLDAMEPCPSAPFPEGFERYGAELLPPDALDADMSIGVLLDALDAMQGGMVSISSPEDSNMDLRAKATEVLSSVDITMPLKTVCESLGVTALPRYSLTCFGQIAPADALRILHCGIRLFVVTDGETAKELKKEGVSEEAVSLRAFRAGYLLEISVDANCGNQKSPTWVIDGKFPNGENDPLRARLQTAAQETGGINPEQYEIVHGPVDKDICVKAGAGTGKTHSMIERVIFILAMGHAQPSEITMVTFTNEATRLMRVRIGRALAIRRRLCRTACQPLLSWIIGLPSLQISTIHSFARRVASEEGARIGVGNAFHIAKLTLEFRAFVRESLSRNLAAASIREDIALSKPEFAQDPQVLDVLVEQTLKELPVFYEWVDAIEKLWSRLEQDGAQLFDPTDQFKVDLSPTPTLTDLFSLVMSRVIKRVIEELRSSYKAYCSDRQTWNQGHLIANAAAAMRAAGQPDDARKTGWMNLKFIFVDEFQDTDSVQMSLFRHVAAESRAKLFYVGDLKQAIYGFRGATDNAFTLMEQYRPNPHAFKLTRNFRSGSVLLERLHSDFTSFSEAGGQPTRKLLPYTEDDELKAPPGTHRFGERVLLDVEVGNVFEELIQQIKNCGQRKTWDHVVVLCRTNREARAVKEALRDRVDCITEVGGEFFSSLAVREIRVFLEALVDPSDEAALLELLESSWGPGLIKSFMEPWSPLMADNKQIWKEELGKFYPWSQRLVQSAKGVVLEDLEGLKARVQHIAELTRTHPMLAVLRESTACFTPECCQEPSERRHYRRCLDHLFSLANERFGASGATLACVLDWLCVQIATNETEDEPTRQGDAESVHHKEREYPVLAVTVHSAKGQEYRNVIIAQTARKFDTRPPGLRAITMLEVDGQNQPAQIRCLWQLADKSNFHQNDAEAKNLIATVDDRVDREEARLLYVAMTRAISKLVVFRTVTREMSWGKLLEGAVP